MGANNGGKKADCTESELREQHNFTKGLDLPYSSSEGKGGRIKRKGTSKGEGV